MNQPNVIFLFSDDQRFNTIEAVNNPDIKTPNLNKLVQKGTYCSQAYIMGGTTGAVCMPSRAMVHSGKQLFHLKDSGESIPDDHMLMGEYFQRQGYSTYGIGKWHNGVESFKRSFSGGDKIFFGGMDDHWNVPVCSYHPDGRYPDPRLHNWDGGTGEIIQIPKVFDEVEHGHHSSDMFGKAAKDFLTAYAQEDGAGKSDGNGKDNGAGKEDENGESDGAGESDEAGKRPFFLYVAYMAPHDPRTMPEKYLKMYDQEKTVLPDNFMPQHPFDNGEMHVRDEKLAGYPREEAEIRRHLTEYYAMITHLDDTIGEILDEADKNGLLDNTLIVLAGDNGLALGSHGLMGKQNMYDHSLHVPLLFAGPGIAAGRQVTDFCYLNDIFPTLCDLTGFEAPDGLEGQSIACLLEAEPSRGNSSSADNAPPRMDASSQSQAASSRQELLFAYKNIQRAVLDAAGNKYIIYFNEDGSIKREQLFNLQQDPLELKDLIHESDSKKIIDHLRSSMKNLMRSMDDPMLSQI